MRSGQEAFVVAHHELAVDLLHRLEGDAHRDQDRHATEGELADVPQREDEQRQDRDRGQEQRSGQRDAVQHLRQVLLGRRPRTDAGDEAALLADDVGLLGRVERDRRVEVGEEDDEHREEQDVEPVLVLHQVVVDPRLDPVPAVAERGR